MTQGFKQLSFRCPLLAARCVFLSFQSCRALIHAQFSGCKHHITHAARFRSGSTSESLGVWDGACLLLSLLHLLFTPVCGNRKRRLRLYRLGDTTLIITARGLNLGHFQAESRITLPLAVGKFVTCNEGLLKMKETLASIPHVKRLITAPLLSY